VARWPLESSASRPPMTASGRLPNLMLVPGQLQMFDGRRRRSSNKKRAIGTSRRPMRRTRFLVGAGGAGGSASAENTNT
jgi:hypothetical protein